LIKYIKRKEQIKEHDRKTFAAFDVVFDNYNNGNMDTKHMINTCKVLHKKIRKGNK